MDQSTKNKTIRLIAIYASIVILLLLGYLAFYMFKNGRLEVKTSLDIVKVEVYSKPEYKLAKTSKSKKSFNLASGDYLIKVYFEKNQSYSTEVNIQRWLKTTVISPIIAANSPTKALNSTQPNYLPIGAVGGKKYISFLAGRTTQIFANPTLTKAFKLKDVTDAHYLADGTLMVAVNKGNEADFYYYNPQTGENVPIGNMASTGRLGIYYADDSLFTILDGQVYNIKPTGIWKSTIPEGIEYSSNSNVPIVSRNNDSIAFLNGNDYSMNDLEFEENFNDSNLKNASLNVFSLDDLAIGSKIKSIAMGKAADISGISLSPDSKHVAVIHDRYTRVFNIESGELVMQLFSSADVDDLYWVDNDSFIFTDVDLSISIARIANRESYTVLAPNDINITNLCGYKDGILYFTGFDMSIKTKQLLPAGYFVEIKV